MIVVGGLLHMHRWWALFLAAGQHSFLLRFDGCDAA
tara:strand:- start:266 stop:373 length:108 start_codon:yes stop_codon:yes gene_type:complete